MTSSKNIVVRYTYTKSRTRQFYKLCKTLVVQPCRGVAKGVFKGGRGGGGVWCLKFSDFFGK